MRNPERVGLVQPDDFAADAFSRCLLAGYPERKPLDPGYWDQFDKIVLSSRKEGLM